ncbi:MAG: hypothetical protein WBM08_12165 [Prochlorococcaceae cyanobacterium]
MNAGAFIEIHGAATVEVCRGRDTFNGISSPNAQPKAPVQQVVNDLALIWIISAP